jgi:hypothetical protein
MARGEHPQRTPFYGVCLLMVAFGACWLASQAHPAWVAALIYVAAFIAASIGLVMTFRDYG